MLASRDNYLSATFPALVHRSCYCFTQVNTWPEPTLLREKLYGNLEELRRTAAFMRTTDI